jgi:hypothetical protein
MAPGGGGSRRDGGSGGLGCLVFRGAASPPRDRRPRLVSEPLGCFTPADLRAGGINRRGLLQPLLPRGAGIDDSDVVTGSPLRLREGEWIEPFGPLALVLPMAAVARSIVVERSASLLPWLLFGQVGRTTKVLDLQPDSEQAAYLAQRSTLLDATASLVAGRGIVARETTAAGRPPGRELLEAQATTLATITAVSILNPKAPVLQQRLGLAAHEGEQWLILGTRAGDEIGWSAAPATQERIERAVVAMLSGKLAEL